MLGYDSEQIHYGLRAHFITGFCSSTSRVYASTFSISLKDKHIRVGMLPAGGAATESKLIFQLHKHLKGMLANSQSHNGKEMGESLAHWL